MDIYFWLELVIFSLLMGFSAFFSSSETALFSLDKVQIEQMRRENHPRVGLIERLLSQPRQLIMTILIGNELVNVAASVISAALVIKLLGTEQKWMNLLIMVPILLLVGEITPKTLAIRNNVAFASAESIPIDWFSRIIKPIRIVVRFVADRIITLIVGTERSPGNIITEDMVRALAQEAVGEGTLDHEEAQFIGQIFDFGNKTVADVMTPRSEISFLRIDMSLLDVLAKQQLNHHSKIPIYKKNRDSVIGILYMRDLLGINIKKLSKDRTALKRLLRQAYFVPETKPAVELFDAFRQRQLSIALTVDEYGGITGLVTIEDLLECIFGDISSPSDVAFDQYIRDIAQDRFEVDGACELSDFDDVMGTKFSSDSTDTIGGLILNEFGELPAVNTRLELGGFLFIVTKVEENRIKLIEAERLEGFESFEDTIPSEDKPSQDPKNRQASLPDNPKENMDSN